MSHHFLPFFPHKVIYAILVRVFPAAVTLPFIPIQTFPEALGKPGREKSICIDI